MKYCFVGLYTYQSVLWLSQLLMFMLGYQVLDSYPFCLWTCVTYSCFVFMGRISCVSGFYTQSCAVFVLSQLQLPSQGRLVLCKLCHRCICNLCSFPACLLVMLACELELEPMSCCGSQSPRVTTSQPEELSLKLCILLSVVLSLLGYRLWLLCALSPSFLPLSSWLTTLILYWEKNLCDCPVTVFDSRNYSSLFVSLLSCAQ